MTPSLKEMLYEVDNAKYYLPSTPLARCHDGPMKEFARRYAHGLEAFCERVNAMAERFRRRIQVSFKDSEQFYAGCGSPEDEAGLSVVPILISLGCIPRVYGFAHRLAVSDLDKSCGGNYPDHFMHFDNVSGQDIPWDEDIDPVGMILAIDAVELLTAELALDTMVLLFLHELTHAWNGHTYYSCKSEDENRALETDADFGAGFYFCSLASVIADIFQMPAPGSSPMNVLRRLGRAAFSLAIHMRKYPSPPTAYPCLTARVQMFLGGASHATRLTMPSFDKEEARRQYYESLVPMALGLISAGRDEFCDWSESEGEKSDLERQEKVTLPTLSRLIEDELRCRLPPIQL